MDVAQNFEYHHIFDEPRPSTESLLRGIPSKFAIGLLTIINDTLTIKGQNPDTQEFLLNNLSQNFPESIRNGIFDRVLSLIRSGEFELFSFSFTMEFINRELIDFREENPSRNDDPSTDELNFFKSYIVIIDEMVQRDTLTLKKELKDAEEKGGKYIEKLMWPHLIKQFEFTNRPDAIYERYKGRALMSYIENQPKFKEYASGYFKSLGCNSGSDYLNRLESLIVRNLQREKSSAPMDYFFRIKVSMEEPVFESLVIEPEVIRKNVNKQIDYRGLKEKPIFKWAHDEYIVPYWDYLYNALFMGLIFSFYNKSGIQKAIPRFDNFKSIVGREFADEILFRNTMTKCFTREGESLYFFEDNDAFNPDCYYRRGNNIFIMEFKDYLMATDVIQSGSYEIIKNAIEEKFVGDTNNGQNRGKGINQLAWNIELLKNKPGLFWEIDENAKNNNLKLKDMDIYPLIIQTNIYFDLPGVNDHLNEIFQKRIQNIKSDFKSIKPFTMIHFQYFFERILLFADARFQLDEEINFYHSMSRILKLKAESTRAVDDWFNGLSQFSMVESTKSSSQLSYRKAELLNAINECWKIASTKE